MRLTRHRGSHARPPRGAAASQILHQQAPELRRALDVPLRGVAPIHQGTLHGVQVLRAQGEEDVRGGAVGGHELASHNQQVTVRVVLSRGTHVDSRDAAPPELQHHLCPGPVPRAHGGEGSGGRGVQGVLGPAGEAGEEEVGPAFDASVRQQPEKSPLILPIRRENSVPPPPHHHRRRLHLRQQLPRRQVHLADRAGARRLPHGVGVGHGLAGDGGDGPGDPGGHRAGWHPGSAVGVVRSGPAHDLPRGVIRLPVRVDVESHGLLENRRGHAARGELLPGVPPLPLGPHLGADVAALLVAVHLPRRLVLQLPAPLARIHKHVPVPVQIQHPPHLQHRLLHVPRGRPDDREPGDPGLELPREPPGDDGPGGVADDVGAGDVQAVQHGADVIGEEGRRVRQRQSSRPNALAGGLGVVSRSAGSSVASHVQEYEFALRRQPGNQGGPCVAGAQPAVEENHRILGGGSAAHPGPVPHRHLQRHVVSCRHPVVSEGKCAEAHGSQPEALLG
mmetsp:Transcript_88828/g.237733  ORF Transcript_88828/g.237733 Transcript_88828/m.237733 type:complete len:506 (-) Transcript_88828:642-2159(-)